MAAKNMARPFVPEPIRRRSGLLRRLRLLAMTIVASYAPREDSPDGITKGTGKAQKHAVAMSISASHTPQGNQQHGVIARSEGDEAIQGAMTIAASYTPLVNQQNGVLRGIESDEANRDDDDSGLVYAAG